MEKDSATKLKFPRLRAVTLKNFTLYAAKPKISTVYEDGVFCLAGANGLGKSTFLAAINFGVTGLVADPGRKFESIDEFYEDNLDYSKNFFRGRIESNDRDDAEIFIEMDVGDRKYSITRGMFEVVKRKLAAAALAYPQYLVQL